MASSDEASAVKSTENLILARRLKFHNYLEGPPVCLFIICRPRWQSWDKLTTMRQLPESCPNKTTSSNNFRRKLFSFPFRLSGLYLLSMTTKASICVHTWRVMISFCWTCKWLHFFNLLPLMWDTRWTGGNHRQTASKVGSHKTTKERTPQRRTNISQPHRYEFIYGVQSGYLIFFVKGFHLEREKRIKKNSTASLFRKKLCLRTRHPCSVYVFPTASCHALKPPQFLAKLIFLTKTTQQQGYRVTWMHDDWETNV